jgi:hypothetical protein
VDVLRQNKDCCIGFHEKHWNGVTREGVRLVLDLVEKNPKKRLSAQDALKSAWFTEQASEPIYVPEVSGSLGEDIPIATPTNAIPAEIFRRM